MTGEKRHKSNNPSEQEGRAEENLEEEAQEQLEHSLLKTKSELELQNIELAEANRRVEKYAEEFEKLFELCPLGLMLTNSSGFIINANQKMASLLECEQSELKGTTFSQFTSGSHINTFSHHSRGALGHEESETVDLDITVNKKNNKTLRITSINFELEAGDYGLLSTIEDVTRNIELERSNKLSGLAFKNASDAILILDKDLKIIQINESAKKLSKTSLQKLKNKPFDFFLSNIGFRISTNKIKNLSGQKSQIFRIKNNNDMEQKELYFRLNAIKVDAKSDSYVITFLSDVTQQKLNEAKLKEAALLDPLTKLPNREKILNDIESLIQSTTENTDLFATAFMDLDSFKKINDHFGHDVGDVVLTSIAKRIKNRLKSEDIIGRIGGDEFILLFRAIKNKSDCFNSLHRILQHLNEPIIVKGHAFKPSFSIGVSFYPQNKTVTAEQLLRQADQAMYEAKLNGKNRIEYYKQSTEDFWKVQINHINTIRDAIKQNQLTLYYQPIVNNRGCIEKYEVLLRWNHPTLGIVAAGDIFTNFNTDELNLELDRWVVSQSFWQLERWNGSISQQSLTINISSFFLEDESTIQFINELEQAHPNVDSTRIQFEIIESSFIQSIEEANTVLTRLINKGYSFSLDDFGTGYSSLSYFHKLPTCCIKLDKSFVEDVCYNSNSQSLCRCIIDLAHSLNKTVIAEGVEDQSQYSILSQMGCDLYQGFMISYPLTASNSNLHTHYRLPH